MGIDRGIVSRFDVALNRRLLLMWLLGHSVHSNIKRDTQVSEAHVHIIKAASISVLTLFKIIYCEIQIHNGMNEKHVWTHAKLQLRSFECFYLNNI